MQKKDKNELISFVDTYNKTVKSLNLQHRWFFLAPIHTNNIGRNDIALRIAKAPQLHLQNFAKGIPDEILICHKFFRDTAYTRHTFKAPSFMNKEYLRIQRHAFDLQYFANLKSN